MARALLAVAIVVLSQVAVGGADPVLAEGELNCRVRHEVVNSEAFTQTVLDQRSAHADTTFRHDTLADQLLVESIEVPTDLSVFAAQPLEIGPLAAGAEWGIRLHPIYRTTRFHNGLDVRADHGVPIEALAEGTVVVAAYRGGYGQTVVLDHGGGFSTLYAHLSVRSVFEGQEVIAGEVIGNVGSSGTATGSHLHLETRLGGVPVDPRWFVPVLPDRSGQLDSGRAPVELVVPGGELAQRQIERLYLAAFGRLPSSEETKYWIGQCRSGVPLEALAEVVADDPTVITRLGSLEPSELLALSESPEIQAELADEVLDPRVRRLYLAVLGREPDVSGSYHWSSRTAAGASLVEIAAEMGLSAEYSERFGGLSNDEFLDRMYLLLFDRLPDAGGRSHWLGRIEELGRWQVLVAFVESEEGRARLG